MRVIYTISFVLAGMLAFGTSAHAVNPGKSADYCMQADMSGDKLTFHNRCDQKIFVIWCGEMKYSKKRCGDGPEGGFYTQSRNIRAGDRYEVGGVEGTMQWGSCLGGISFGHDKFSDSNNGSYRCLE